MQIMALSSSPARKGILRAAGALPLQGNLDHPATLARLAGLGHRVLHLAPPPSEGWQDTRTLALLRVLRRRSLPRALVYGSTSGVYGHCSGGWVHEHQTLAPQTQRGHRRVDAERSLHFWSRSCGVPAAVLRIPGIYAPDREGGTPRARLLKGVPVLQPQDDVYTNHIHADDLARACISALWRGKFRRSYNINDDSTLKMGDYFDLAADLYGLPRPLRVTLQAARELLSPLLLSFMSESRRLVNARMKKELRLRLRYPGVREGLSAGLAR
jgi:nucleoside-diphosphate-sugar epimerase